MRVDERYLRYGLALAFALAGIFAFLVRGDAWPFKMEALRLAPHAAPIAHQQLEGALSEDLYDAPLITQLSHDLNREDPFAPLPFEAMLLLQLERDPVDPRLATELAQAALQREARNLSARLFLLDQAVIEQRWDDAFAAFGRAYDLWPSESVELRQMMYESLTDDAWADAFMARLQNDDAWAQTFVRQLPVASVSTDVAIQLHRPFVEQHGQLLSDLQREKSLQDAHQAWQALRPEEAALDRFGRIDFEFQNTEALRPFGWSLNSNFAEIDRRQGGLQVEYRGRQTPRIAEQIIFIPPGDYQLVSSLTLKPSEPAGDIAWVMRCIDTGEEVVKASVFDPVFDDTQSGVEFEIPESCPYQILSLRGYPGTFTRRFSLRIGRLALEPLEAKP
ncbi:MAG: hypothetical protein AAF437_09730 [Pseudomonadota bacterium]